MDPDAALTECLDLANDVLNDEAEFYPDNLGQDAIALAERFIAIHEFITKGGFLPAAWRVGRSAAEEGGE